MASDTKNDGGPAFPRAVPTGEWPPDQALAIVQAHAGMSLRDYFAAKAPIPDEVLADAIDTTRYLLDAQVKLARWCYAWADAMLAERAKAEDR